MDDLSATINQFLSNPDNVRQVQEMAASLGLAGQEPQRAEWQSGGNAHTGGTAPPQAPRQADNLRGDDLAALRGMLGQFTNERQQQPYPPPTPQPPAPPQNDSGLSGLLSQLGGAMSQNGGGGLNMGALSDILGSLGGSAPDLSSLLGRQSAAPQPSGSGGGLDLSALSGILGNLGVGENKSPPPPSTPSGLSALTAMLGGNNASSSGTAPGGMDMSMLMRFQQAMSGMNASAGNMRLLLALKGHLRDEARAAKVDDAIRVMQVIQFLPLLKESGLFGKLEEILDGFNLGGIGNMLGSLTGGGR